jgi:hypothetical protein
MELEEYKFVVNPYKPCIANMETANGKQLTMIWHVDNLMASCKDDFELTRFSCDLGRKYGTKLKIHLDKKHNYLGMDVEFTS